jgi:hypothetical protein
MRRICVAFVCSVFVGLPAVATLQTPASKAQRPSGWVLTKKVDKMTDAAAFTILRRSNEGTASLGLHCDGSSYTAFLVVPRTMDVGAITLAEVRFDKQEPIGFTLRRFDEELLVGMIGGSKTGANFVLMTDDAGKAVAGEFSAAETARMGMRVAKAIQSGSQMIYRLPLAKAGNGTEATFNLTGFTQTAAPMTNACPVQ